MHDTDNVDHNDGEVGKNKVERVQRTAADTQRKSRNIDGGTFQCIGLGPTLPHVLVDVVEN